MPKRGNSKPVRRPPGPTKAQRSHKPGKTPQEYAITKHEKELKGQRASAAASIRPVKAQYGATQAARATGLLTAAEISSLNKGGSIGPGGIASSHSGASTPTPAPSTTTTTTTATTTASHSSSPGKSKPLNKKLGKRYADALVDAKQGLKGKNKAERTKIIAARKRLVNMRKRIVKMGYGSLDTEKNKKGGYNAHGIYKALTGETTSTIKGLKKKPKK